MYLKTCLRTGFIWHTFAFRESKTSKSKPIAEKERLKKKRKREKKREVENSFARGLDGLYAIKKNFLQLNLVFLRRPTCTLHHKTWNTLYIFKYEYQKYCKSVFCYQNCSDLLWEKNCTSDQEKLLKFEADGQEFSKNLRSLEQFI